MRGKGEAAEAGCSAPCVQGANDFIIYAKHRLTQAEALERALRITYVRPHRRRFPRTPALLARAPCSSHEEVSPLSSAPRPVLN